MEKNIKFILGGVLVVLSLLLKDWAAAILISPPPGSGFAIVIAPLLFLAVLIAGFSLIADSIFKK